MLLAPCPREWLHVWCVYASPGRDSNLPQTSHLISIKLYTAGECVTPGEPPLFKLSAGNRSCPNQPICNEPQPTGLATCCPDVVDAPGVSSPTSPSPLFFVSLFLSVEVCFWSVLISILISCQSPSAFVVLQQIRLGSYEVPLTGHWPQHVPPALCLSHYRMCEPLQLLLAQQHCFFTFTCTNSSPR